MITLKFSDYYYYYYRMYGKYGKEDVNGVVLYLIHETACHKSGTANVPSLKQIQRSYIFIC